PGIGVQPSRFRVEEKQTEKKSVGGDSEETENKGPSKTTGACSDIRGPLQESWATMGRIERYFPSFGATIQTLQQALRRQRRQH
ncbi:MAG: hypothetical protein V3U10_03010, partial [Bacteroidota bacterium]